jgi:type I restriction enzyme S subunit
MKQKSELPEGWVSSLLINLILKRKGKKPSLLAEEKWNESVPYLDIKAFENGIIRQYADISSSVLINKGDILVVWDGARCGLVGKAPVDGAIGSTLMYISQNSLNSDYLYYFLQSNYERINSNPRGSGIPHVEPDLFWNLEVQIPPLREQRRIVSAIEALFVRLEATNERLDRVLEILKKFRESVLAAACDGRLTEEWRKGNSEIENSITLLKKIGNEVLGENSRKKGNLNPQFDEKQYDLPLKWNWASLSDVSISISDGDHQAPPKSESGVPFIVISNISSGKLDLSKTMYVPENYYENLSESRKPKSQDILYSVTGSYGIPILISEDYMFCFQRHIALIRPHSDVSSKYLYYILKSTLVYNQATKVATGIAQLTVPLSGLRMIKIPLPPLPEQQEIVKRIDALFAFADSIEKKVAAAREKTEKLRHSILAKAFSGELVETEAEIARREGRDYETAEVLLERIKKERGKNGKKQ